MTTQPRTQPPLRPCPAGHMPQASLAALRHHLKGRHAIRTTYDGPEAGLRQVDARDLEAATVAHDVVFAGPQGLDTATALAASRWLNRNPGKGLGEVRPDGAFLLINTATLDGSATARKAMATLAALREVAADAQ